MLKARSCFITSCIIQQLLLTYSLRDCAHIHKSFILNFHAVDADKKAFY